MGKSISWMNFVPKTIDKLEHLFYVYYAAKAFLRGFLPLVLLHLKICNFQVPVVIGEAYSFLRRSEERIRGQAGYSR